MGSIRIHDLGSHLCDHNPDDEHKDGVALGGDRWVGEEDHNHGQSNRSGDNNHNDNP
jgi:hypothetical protein